MDLPTTPDQSPNAEPVARTNGRVLRRIEARNELTAADAPDAFDFVVDDSDDDSTLGILASYLGAAACRQSQSLDLTIDVSRVTVEVERPPTRSDGGMAERDGTAAGVGADRRSAAETSPARVRALVEARTAESAETIAAWRDRILADCVPFSIAPGLVGVDLLVASTAAGVADASD
ncbi:hypothetical protein [Salinigranum salinum]|uniref:hypothetical protein n=1 Tax=Salinigranum salinum TaxID=1364937 RepID=UPI00126119AA|nr:hypothetical protein [Salinigranum salinum]